MRRLEIAAGKKLGIHMKDELIASFRGTEKRKAKTFQRAFWSEGYMMKHLRFGPVYAKNGSIEWASGKERLVEAARC